MKHAVLVVLISVISGFMSCGGDEYLFDWQQQFEDDIEAIDKYLAEHNIVAMQSSSGLRFVIHKLGSGSYPIYGQTVVVHYEGRLLDGTVFDSSYERGEPSEFVVGRLIQGFNEGITYIGQGGSISLYMPSRLGYGKNSPSEDIPPNSILIFDVELLNIK